MTFREKVMQRALETGDWRMYEDWYGKPKIQQVDWKKVDEKTVRSASVEFVSKGGSGYNLLNESEYSIEDYEYEVTSYHENGQFSKQTYKKRVTTQKETYIGVNLNGTLRKIDHDDDKSTAKIDDITTWTEVYYEFNLSIELYDDKINPPKKKKDPQYNTPYAIQQGPWGNAGEVSYTITRTPILTKFITLNNYNYTEVIDIRNGNRSDISKLMTGWISIIKENAVTKSGTFNLAAKITEGKAKLGRHGGTADEYFFAGLSKLKKPVGLLGKVGHALLDLGSNNYKRKDFHVLTINTSSTSRKFDWKMSTFNEYDYDVRQRLKF